jgi:hypothetical protein
MLVAACRGQFLVWCGGSTMLVIVLVVLGIQIDFWDNK